METTFDNKCVILSDVWLNYRDDEDLEAFVQYNDLGLPLAYAIGEKIVKPTAEAKKFVEEAFDLLVVALDIEDEGFESLDEMFDKSTPYSEE